ncbi:MAG: diacylglycerol kinase family lipid kinase, partial [Eggerthellaceae bacterium]|nr:diacylglycerol kinase family lipid kinase [Eggerthellaceae bacterium]
MATSNRNVLLIANPAAQRGHGAEAARIAHDLLREWVGDEAVTLALTDYAGHAVDLAAEASSERYDTVIALGGDGIVHEVVNGLMRLPFDKRPSFGLVPVGSGNDYARTLGMSESVPDAVVQFLDAREQLVDVGCCNGEYYAETLSFGLDAAIALDTVVRRERTGQQGTILYMMSGLDILLHHLEEYEFKAILDGERTIEGHMLMFAVQNGVTYGGGFRICPEAR